LIEVLSHCISLDVVLRLYFETTEVQTLIHYFSGLPNGTKQFNGAEQIILLILYNILEKNQKIME